MSLEILGEGWRGRARHGAPGPVLVDGFGLSAPILVDEHFEQDSLPLLEAMLPTTGRSSAGIYFELYGAQPDEPLRFALTAAPAGTGASVLGRIARSLRPRDLPIP